jgi:bacterioferritin-associated ferredoxin
VIGGGNSAVDAARVALRLGSETVLIYRRSRKEMPAFPSEVQEMEEEGGKILFLALPVRFIAEEGRLRSVECAVMELQEPEPDGRRKAVAVPGQFFTVEANSVIVAVGEDPDLAYLPPDFQVENLRMKTGPRGETSRRKVFAGGDLTGTAGTVSGAIRTGRIASQAIDASLQGGKPAEPARLEVVRGEQMNLDFFDPRAKTLPVRLPFPTAAKGFAEIYSGFSAETAREEGKRCLGCGSLPLFLPDDCRGCGNCEQRCPTLAIQMKPLDPPVVVRVAVAESDPRRIDELCRRAHLNPKSIVCFCTTTRAEEIAAAIFQGAKSPEEISLRTGARTGCSVLCIQPIFRLLEAARLPFSKPAAEDVWYRTMPNIWEISREIRDRYDKAGFRFAEDLQFYETLTKR